MLQKDSYPAYFINLQLNPEHIDINVHPTKQEIKFTDEKLVYAFVKSAVKHALAQFSISPALDFSLNATIQQMPAVTQPSTASTQNKVYNSPLYQTFTQSNQAHKIEHSGNLKSWQSFYNNNNENTPTTQAVENVTAPTLLQATTLQPEQVHQLNNSYIAIEQPDGFVLVQQQYAHQRVIYHRLTTTTAALATQQSLFPETLQLTPPDAILLTELLPHFNYLGYQIQPFGNNTFVLQGTPAAALVSQSQSEIEIILEHYKNQSSSYKLPPLQKLSLTLCWQQSIKLGIALSKKEMLALLTDWYNTPNNHTSPFGKKILANLTADYLKKLFS